MDFFGIGFGELLLILIIALIIWGPRRLPEIARTIGNAMRALRKSTYDFTSQVTKEIELSEAETKEKAPPSLSEDSAKAREGKGQ